MELFFLAFNNDFNRWEGEGFYWIGLRLKLGVWGIISSGDFAIIFFLFFFGLFHGRFFYYKLLVVSLLLACRWLIVLVLFDSVL